MSKYFICDENGIQHYIDQLDNVRIITKPVKYGGLLRKSVQMVYIGDTINTDIDCVQLVRNVDKRTKLYKENKSNIAEYRPTEKQLCDYIKDNSSLNDDECRRLAVYCNFEYGKIKNELIKFIYSGVALDEYIKDNEIISVFDLCDAVIKNSSPFTTRRKYVENSVFGFLANMATKCKDIYDYRHGQYSGNPYFRRQIASLAKYRTDEELVDIIKLCNELDLSIKKGLIDGAICIDYLIMKTCKTKERL